MTGAYVITNTQMHAHLLGNLTGNYHLLPPFIAAV